MGYWLLGLDGTAETDLEHALDWHRGQPVALVMGAEGPACAPRRKTRATGW